MIQNVQRKTPDRGYTRNSGKRWRHSDIFTLRQLVKKQTPVRLISLRLGRPDAAIVTKARALNLCIDKNVVYAPLSNTDTSSRSSKRDKKTMNENVMVRERQADLFSEFDKTSCIV